MKTIFTFTIILFSIPSYSQQVFSSSGKSLSNAQILLDNTIGEPVTFTLQNSTIKLTQGFQQNNYNISTGIKNALLDVGIRVYPNPAGDNLQVQLSNPVSNKLQLYLFGINGNKIWQGQIGNGIELQNIDVSQVAAGSYILQLVDETKNLFSTYKIEKINQ